MRFLHLIMFSALLIGLSLAKKKTIKITTEVTCCGKALAGVKVVFKEADPVSDDTLGIKMTDGNGRAEIIVPEEDGLFNKNMEPYMEYEIVHCANRNWGASELRTPTFDSKDEDGNREVFFRAAYPADDNPEKGICDVYGPEKDNEAEAPKNLAAVGIKAEGMKLLRADRSKM